MRNALRLTPAIAVIAMAAALSAACGPDSATVVSSPAEQGSASAQAPAKAVAHLGDVVSINGIEKGSKADVTVLQVADNAAADNDFDTPKQGNKYFAVQFRIADTGTGAYSDAPSNGAKVVDAQGQAFDAAIVTGITAGPLFPTMINIAPGDTSQGFIVFEVPAATVVSKVQFGLNSGMGTQTAQWALS